jgi:hypothetical protein
MAVMAIADRLGRLPHEVREMPVTDFVTLCAFYEIREEERAARTARGG